MITSNAFKNDTLSKNTQLIPLVIIEKLIQAEFIEPEGGTLVESIFTREFISTHNIQVGDNYFKPLLLDMPTLSQKLDLINAKFQVSSLTLNISNVDYNNSGRISEKLDSFHLINSVVCIHYKSQSCTTIQLPEQDEDGIVDENTDIDVGCPRIFTGVIREVKHQKDRMTLTVEDITEKKITRDLPNNKLGSTDNIPEKYQNAYIPMFYGSLENAPTVSYYEGGDIIFRADSEPINLIRYDEVGDGITWKYNSIKIYSGQYLPLTRKVHEDFVKEDEHTQENPYYEPTNEQQYAFTSDNAVAFKNSSMLNLANRVEVLYNGKPKSVLLTRDFNGISVTSIASGWFDNIDPNTYQYIDGTDYQIITDNNYTTLINENQTSEYLWHNSDGNDAYDAHLLVGLFSLQWDSGVDGAKYVRVIKNKINNIMIPVKGDLNMPSGLGQWDNAWGVIYISDIPNLLQDTDYGFNVGDLVFTPQTISLENLISFGDGSTNYWDHWAGSEQLSYNQYAPFQLATSFYDHIQIGDVPLTSPDIVPILRFADGNNAKPQAGEGWSSFEFWTDTLALDNSDNLPSGGLIAVNIDLDIKEIDVTSLANFDEAIDKNYYLNARGRADDFLKNYQHFWEFQGDTIDIPVFEIPDFLENPVDIIRHILVSECGISNDEFDEDEFNFVWSIRQQGGNALDCSPIRLAFSVNEEISSKKLLNNISKNCLVYPRIKNNGKIGFTSIQRTYTPENSYDIAKEIDTNDIISYTLGQTPSSELVSKIDVSYGYDYEKKKNLKTTSTKEITVEELDWNGITDIEDNYLNYKADYIHDEQSANTLRDLIFYNRKAQHLEIELVLPLSYMDLETGDYCKFPINRLIEGIKAHGINYTIPDVIGGVLRMPMFKVINVSKNLNNIKVKLYQLHWLESEAAGISAMGMFPWSDIDFEGLNLPVIDEGEFYEESPYPIFPMDSLRFFIGTNSSFQTDVLLGGTPISDWTLPSSNTRRFTITDETMMEHAYGEYETGLPNQWGTILGGQATYYIWFGFVTDDLNSLFGQQNFIENGDLEWSCLLDPSNHPNFGYNFPENYLYNPLTIRMFGDPNWGYEHQPFTLKFQNIAGTQFDPEHPMYEDAEIWEDYEHLNIPDYLDPPDVSLPIKMMWVAYKEGGILVGNGYDQMVEVDVGYDEEYDEVTHWFRRNLQLKFAPYGYTSPSDSGGNSEKWYNHYIFEMELGQDQHIQQTLNGNLWYNANRSGELFFDNAVIGDNGNGGSGTGEGGSSAPDEDEDIIYQFSILTIVLLVSAIMSGFDIEQVPEGWDLNDDDILDIFDVIIMINLILGNDNG